MTLGVQAQTDDQTNLFDWRGPFQTGVSPETYEGWAFEGEKSLKWTYDVSSRGCPVVVDGRLYSFGYNGTEEVLSSGLFFPASMPTRARRSGSIA